MVTAFIIIGHMHSSVTCSVFNPTPGVPRRAETVFCSLLHPQHLEQHLEHSRCSINISLMHEWMNTVHFGVINIGIGSIHKIYITLYIRKRYSWILSLSSLFQLEKLLLVKATHWWSRRSFCTRRAWVTFLSKPPREPQVSLTTLPPRKPRRARWAHGTRLTGTEPRVS